MENISSTITYWNIRDSAWNFLIVNKINALPYSLLKIARQNEWNIYEYEQYQKIADVLDIKNLRYSCDAWTVVFNKVIFIFYKKTNNVAQLRESIAHEFGHILLKHLNNLSTIDYEKEATMFAFRILMPACVLKECNVYSPTEISLLCGTTMSVATM